MKKTATFACVHFTVAFSIGYLITGDIMLGGAIAIIEPVVNTLAYYVHERVWHWKATRSTRLTHRWTPIHQA